MDYDLGKFPLPEKINYVVKDGTDWTVVRDYRMRFTRMTSYNHFMKIITRHNDAIVITPDALVKLITNFFIYSKYQALITNTVLYQRVWKPITLLIDRAVPDRPTVLVLKMTHEPQILLCFSFTDFERIANLLRECVTLDFEKAFDHRDLPTP